PTDQLGDGIDLLHRESDDGRAARQPRDLAVAGEAELRQARARDDIDARDQLLDDRLHRTGADQHGLGPAAPVQQPVGEDMAAVEIGAELDLVDRHEIDLEIARHRLDRADPEARPLGLYLLLAGDERDRVGPDL